MEASKVRMSGALEFPFGAILKDAESTPKKLNLKAIFRIEAPVLKSRPSIDLVVVLDITSSNGLPEIQPSKLDLLKKAIGFMISNLDNGDRIAVVAFRNPKDKWSPDGLIEISTEGRKLAKQRVNKLVTVGFAKAKSSLARAVEMLPDWLGIMRATTLEERLEKVQQSDAKMRHLEHAFTKCSNGKAFFGGDSIGYLDLALGSFLFWFKTLHQIFGVEIIDTIKTPLLAAWAGQVMETVVAKEVAPEEDRMLQHFKKVYRAAAL